MYHSRYCLAHYPGISSNITNATDLRTPPTPITLAHQSPYPRWHKTYVSHTGTSPTLARQRRNLHQHTSAPHTLAHLARHFWNSHLVCQVISAVSYFIKFFSLFRMFFLSFLLRNCSKNAICIRTSSYFLVRFQWSSVNPK